MFVVKTLNVSVEIFGTIISFYWTALATSTWHMQIIQSSLAITH